VLLAVLAVGPLLDDCPPRLYFTRNGLLRTPERLNPSMPSPIIIDDCHKISIRQMFNAGLIHTGHHSGTISTASGHIQFHTCLSPTDVEGCWIELLGLGRWEIVLQPIGNSPDYPGWQRPTWGVHWFAVGRDGKRVKALLVTPDLKRAGTRWELKAVWRSQWTKSNKRRKASRARILRQLGILHKPDNLSLVFIPHAKPKGQHLITYENRYDSNFTKNADPNIRLVHRPFNMKLRKFYQLLNRLNRTRGKKITNPVKPLMIYPVRKHRVGIETKELLERMAKARGY
jgi:hypothetical protein